MCLGSQPDRPGGRRIAGGVLLINPATADEASDVSGLQDTDSGLFLTFLLTGTRAIDGWIHLLSDLCLFSCDPGPETIQDRNICFVALTSFASSFCLLFPLLASLLLLNSDQFYFPLDFFLFNCGVKVWVKIANRAVLIEQPPRDKTANPFANCAAPNRLHTQV